MFIKTLALLLKQVRARHSKLEIANAHQAKESDARTRQPDRVETDDLVLECPITFEPAHSERCEQLASLLSGQQEVPSGRFCGIYYSSTQRIWILTDGLQDDSMYFLHTVNSRKKGKVSTASPLLSRLRKSPTPRCLPT